MLYYETHSNDPCFNLAFEEYLLKNKKGDSILILWQNANTIVVGLNQNTAEEVNAAFVEQHGITVVRRTTGGGAVYHDMGNLNYSFISDLGDAASMDIGEFSKPVCAALASMGVTAEVSGRNDIQVNGKKISGVAQRIYRDRIIHHGTLLFESDSNMISGALNVDPSKFSSKSTKSVRSRVGNIKDFLPQPMSIREFWDRLLQQLTKNGAVTASLTEEELALIRAEAESKYRSWEWTYGKTSEYSYKNRERFTGGLLEVSVLVEQGVIEEIVFSGDYMATTEDEEAVRALKGCRFDRQDVNAVLQTLDLTKMFGGISREEILSVLFGGI